MKKFIHIPDLYISDDKLNESLNLQGYNLVNVEKMEKGGEIIHNQGEAGGYLVGKRHSQGGIKAINKSTNQPLEMEGGEVVITRNAVSDNTKRMFEGEMLTNKEILSRINQSGGGVAFEEGGQIPTNKLRIGGYLEYQNTYFPDSQYFDMFNMARLSAKIAENKPFATQWWSSREVRRVTKVKYSKQIKKNNRVYYKDGININYGVVTSSRRKNEFEIEDFISRAKTLVDKDKVIPYNLFADSESSTYEFFYANRYGNIPFDIDFTGCWIILQEYPTSNEFVFDNFSEAETFLNNKVGKIFKISVVKYNDKQISQQEVDFIFTGYWTMMESFDASKKDPYFQSLENFLKFRFESKYYFAPVYLNACILKQKYRNATVQYPIPLFSISFEDPRFKNVETFKEIFDVVRWFIQNDVASQGYDTVPMLVLWEDGSMITVNVETKYAKLWDLDGYLMLISGWIQGQLDTKNVTQSDLKKDFVFYSWGNEQTKYIEYSSTPLFDPFSTTTSQPTTPSSGQPTSSSSTTETPIINNTPSKTYSILNEYNYSLVSEIETLSFILANTPEYDFEIRTQLSQELFRLKKIVNTYDDVFGTGSDIIDELIDADSIPNARRPMRAASPNEFQPNGDVSLLTAFQQQMVKHNTFTKWFGDFATAYSYNKIYTNDPIPCSKVVTDGGEPLVVFMGVGREFEAVRFNRFPIAYFAVNYDYAEWFAETKNQDGGWVLPFFLNVRNPLDLTIFGINKVPPKDFYDWLFLQTGMTAEQLGFVGAWQEGNVPPMEVWMYIRNNQAFLNILKESKIVDGIHFYENNPSNQVGESNYMTEVWSTFYSNQSKLASSERGKFVLSSVDTFKMKHGGKVK